VIEIRLLPIHKYLKIVTSVTSHNFESDTI